MKEAKEASTMNGRDWKAGKEYRNEPLKEFLECYEARYTHLVQRQYNFNSYSKMLKSSTIMVLFSVKS